MRTTLVNKYHGTPWNVYIGRGTIWGNPFSHLPSGLIRPENICETREEAVSKYRDYITKGSGRSLLPKLLELKGKVLCCTCSPKQCHGDILLELIEKYYPDGQTDILNAIVYGNQGDEVLLRTSVVNATVKRVIAIPIKESFSGYTEFKVDYREQMLLLFGVGDSIDLLFSFPIVINYLPTDKLRIYRVTSTEIYIIKDRWIQ